MELDWTTVLLEMVNFAVLVWLLHRLLYKPVLNVIAQRRAQIDARTEEARRLHEEASALQAQYDGRLRAWEAEQRAARTHLLEDLQRERTTAQAALRAELEQERDNRRAIDAQRRDAEAREAEARASAQGAHFAARLLTRVADPSLEWKLAQAAVDDLAQWPNEPRERLKQACEATSGQITIASAFPLGEANRQQLCERLSALTGVQLSCNWREEPELLAGLRLTVGHLVVQANLQNELRVFTTAASPDDTSSSD